MSSRYNRPYNNYNNKNRRNNNRNRNNYNNQKKKKPQNVNLENTMRIRIDDERLNDFESLDTSFLEGRLDRKVKKNKKAKEKLLREKNRVLFNLQIIKRIFFLLALVCIVVLAVMLFINNVDRNVPAEDKKTSEEKVDIDDNYVFVGDSYTKNLNFDDLDFHYINKSEDNLTTAAVLENLKKKVYDYNPTMVFLELGFVDLKDNKDPEEIISNLEKIIDKIKKNRPYAKIYVESIYPINKDVEDYDEDSLRDDLDNEDIIELNKLILKLTKSKKVNYLDMFSLLEKDGKLNEEYTDNGVKLNSEGNDRVFEKIEKIVG